MWRAKGVPENIPFALSVDSRGTSWGRTCTVDIRGVSVVWLGGAESRDLFADVVEWAAGRLVVKWRSGFRLQANGRRTLVPHVGVHK